MYKRTSIISPIDAIDPDLNSDQIGFEGNRFRVYGSVADTYGTRAINATPSSEIWKALVFPTMPMFMDKNPHIVVGCPSDLLGTFQEELKMISGRPISLDYVLHNDKKTYHEKGASFTPTFHVVPESSAHALGLVGHAKSDLVVVSVGFGTIEMALTDGLKIDWKTPVSKDYGLFRACELFRQELKLRTKFNQDTKTDDQYFFYDALLVDAMEGKQTSHFVITRKVNGIPQAVPMDEIRNCAEIALNKYASELVRQIAIYFETHAIRNIPVFLTGGGILHKPVLNHLLNFFQNSLRREAVDLDPKIAQKTAAEGYKQIAKSIYKQNRLIPSDAVAYGVDVGNHSLIINDTVPLFEDDQDFDPSPAEYKNSQPEMRH